MAKVVQTSLKEEEYRVFKDLLERRKLSIREGLREAVTKMLEDEVRVDPRERGELRDSFGAWTMSEEEEERITSSLKKNWRKTSLRLRGQKGALS